MAARLDGRNAQILGEAEAASGAGSTGGLLFGLFVASLLVGAAIWLAKPAPPAPAPAPTSVDPWVEIRQPLPLFDLDIPRFASSPRIYQAWRARSGAGRRDVLSFGRFSPGADFFRLALTQPLPGSVPQPFFSAVARQAALAGLFIRSSEVPTGATSRFGILSIAGVRLEGDGAIRSCLAFQGGAAQLRITGIGCGGPQRFDQADLACALNRLDLLGGGADAPLTVYFEGAELRRGAGCPSNRL